MDPRLLTINEHRSASYSGRTLFNIRSADLTVAIATNFDTAGEILTRKHAGDRYLAIPTSTPLQQAADALTAAIKAQGAETLNIAGNGIYTLAPDGWTQDSINKHVLDLLWSAHHGIQKIVCGGQTGVDLAGAVAGVALHIPVVMTMPHGYKQRDAHRVDHTHTREEMVRMVLRYAKALSDGPLPVIASSSFGVADLQSSARAPRH